jgi:DNA repair exonuclease SbcCD ATPase subunit
MEGLKLIRAEVKNFKSITHKVVEFNGRSAIILGKNGAGKSSLIQAITSPVNAKMIPSKPIKKGEEAASVELLLQGSVHGEEQTYNVEMHFTPRDKKGRITVTDEDGSKISDTKSMVNSIVGNIGFDILEFIDLGLTKDGKVSKPGVKEQIDILKKFLPEESRQSLIDLDHEKTQVYENRADINKDIKSNKAKMKDAEMDPADIEKYSEKKDDAQIKEQMGQIGEAVSNYDRVKSGVESKEFAKGTLESTISALEKELKLKKEELSTIEGEIDKGNKWLEKRERPSMEALSAELEEIDAHNKKVDEVEALKGFDKNVRELTVQAESLTTRYNAIDGEKAEIFKATPLPVKGLEFSEDEILYNGLPFNENQHPSSTIIGIGIKIAMAMNPNLKLLIIKDGSLIDKKVLNFILKLVEKKGYQVFIETVDTEGEKDLEVNFIEEEIK